MTLHNLPPQPTPFIGRQEELAEIARLLADPACRLLTFVGPGGIGKTRLALEAAAAQLDTYADGVFFVSLQALESPDFIASAVADAINFRPYRSGEPRQQLLNHLRDKNMLLVMDNFEHLPDGADILSDILTWAPDIKIMVTSREALNLQEEWLWPVQGMDFPDKDWAQRTQDIPLESYSAVQLFVQNARRMRPDFSLAREQAGVVQICALVEGMPLGIELASAWVRLLSCEEIAREIEHSLDFLETPARNVPARHRTMRATLEHSWMLLAPSKREVFKQLSVFRGGFTREAAEVVAGASLQTLSILVNKSFLRREPNGRYDLHELLCQYAEEHLNAVPEESERAHDLHCAYYAQFLHQQWAHLQGNRPKEALEAIEQDIDNVRAAWQWAVKHKKAKEIGEALDSLWFFYDTRGWYREGEQAFERAAAALGAAGPGTEPNLILGRVLARQGVLCNSISCYGAARALLEQSLNMFLRLEAQEDIAFALTRLGEVVVYSQGYDQAEPLFRESLALYREIGNQWGAAFALNWLGHAAFVQGQYDAGQQYYQESLAIFQALNNRWGIAILLPSHAYAAIYAGRYDEAERLGREGLALCREVGIEWGVSMSLATLGTAARGQGKFMEAKQYLREALKVALELKLDRHVASTLLEIGEVFRATGEPQRALECFALILRPYGVDAHTKHETVPLKTELPWEMMEAITARSATIEVEPALQAIFAALEPPAGDSAPPPASAAVSPSLADSLTAREVEILRLLAEGKSNREIADQLVFALGTVKWYLNQIYTKLHVTSRTQAIARARELKLLS